MIKKLLNDQIANLQYIVDNNLDAAIYDEFRKDYDGSLAALNKLCGEDEFEPCDCCDELDLIYSMMTQLDDAIADKKYDEDGGNELYYFAVELHIFNYLLNQYEGE